MTNEDVIGYLEYLSGIEHEKVDGILPCDAEIAFSIAINALKELPTLKAKVKELSIYASRCPRCGKREFVKRTDSEYELDYLYCTECRFDWVPDWLNEHDEGS